MTSDFHSKNFAFDNDLEMDYGQVKDDVLDLRKRGN